MHATWGVSPGVAALCGDATVHWELWRGQRREVGHPSRGLSPRRRSGVDFLRVAQLEGSVSLWASPGGITPAASMFQQNKRKVPVSIAWPSSLSISQQRRLLKRRIVTTLQARLRSESAGESWESEPVLSGVCGWTQTRRQGSVPSLLSPFTQHSEPPELNGARA